MKPDFECLCLHPVFWNWTWRAKGQIWFRNRGLKLFSNIVKHTLSRLWAVPPAVAVPASQWSVDLSGSKFRFVKSTHFTQLKSCRETVVRLEISDGSYWESRIADKWADMRTTQPNLSEAYILWMLFGFSATHMPDLRKIRWTMITDDRFRAYRHH